VSYCTLEDIETQTSTAVLIQLTNDTGIQTSIDSSVVDEALLYSSTLIDGYLRGRYELPLNTPFPLLRIIAMDLSIYRLYSRRIQIETPEPVVDAYKNAIKTLEQLQKGVISLQSETSNEIQASPEYKTNKTKEDRMFGKDRLNEY